MLLRVRSTEIQPIVLPCRSNHHYARVRHFKGKGKFIYCKIEDIDALKTLLKSQGISLNTEKAIGQLGQSKAVSNNDLEHRNSSLIQQNKGGRRLVGLGHKPSKKVLDVDLQLNVENFNLLRYREYLEAKYTHQYAKNLYNYLLKYSRCFNNPSELLTVKTSIRSNVLKSMLAVSAYLGVKEDYKAKLKQYGIKWVNNNDSLTAFTRILNGNNLKGLEKWYKEALKVLDNSEKLWLRFLALSGVRKTESWMSFLKIQSLAKDGKLIEQYYNTETKMLEHFRHKEFLRGTKNLYVSAVPCKLIENIAKAKKSVSLATIRKKLNRNKLRLRFKELRQFYATNMRKLGLMQELVSLLQGRVERTVFTQFYLKENPRELADKIISLVEDLESSLLS
jgi:hypothetical protein